MKYAVTIDFGSTFTKVVVVNLVEKRIVLSDKVPSNVNIDARISLNQCFNLAREAIGEKAFSEAIKLTSSSAAGGLRMSVIGLTASQSAYVGEMAALGGGAKIIGCYSGLLTEENIRELETSKSEIILLCGGYERGNTEMVGKNAVALAHSRLRVPIIYSGNSALTKEIRSIMRMYRKKCYTVENIIPAIGELNVEPTQEVIRNLFLDRITDMKGFHEVKQYFDKPFVPTPVAVMNAGELLYQGTEKKQGLGQVMIVDVGGATTDVYSFNENRCCEGAKLVGLEEPFAKRTVEGDLGMRENSDRVLSQGNMHAMLRELDMEEEQLRLSIRKRTDTIDFLPDTEQEKQIDDMIGRTAVHVAARRHAGRVKPSYNRQVHNIQMGKNLSDISAVIGTGGIIVNNPDPKKILKEVESVPSDKGILLPKKIDTYLDKDYVLFSAGLIREIDEEAALEIMLQSIQKCE